MSTETLKFESAQGVYGAISAVHVSQIIVQKQRIVTLEMANRSVVSLTAEAAHKLAVMLYGMSENYAEPIEDDVKPLGDKDFMPGDLVTATNVYRTQLRGNYRSADGRATLKVSGSKKPVQPGYIRLWLHPKYEICVPIASCTLVQRAKSKPEG